MKEAQLKELDAILREREKRHARNPRYQNKLKISQDGFYVEARHKDYSQATIQIGRPDEISPEKRRELEANLKEFIPWRKGPFSLFGISIDSEWQSGQKWERLMPHLSGIEGKTICDVGCNNGYYMYRMAHHKPQMVLGIDPTYPFKLSFDHLQKFTREENLRYELMGFQELTFFPNTFDVIFCLGIVYHHKNPLEVLELCLHALKPGGQLLLESASIPGEEPMTLFPGGRYANIRGVWFIPTHSCLSNWLTKTGFHSIRLCDHQKLTVDEQRSTPWAPQASLREALNPQNTNQTKEGLPRPHRTLFSAYKK